MFSKGNIFGLKYAMNEGNRPLTQCQQWKFRLDIAWAIRIGDSETPPHVLAIMGLGPMEFLSRGGVIPLRFSTWGIQNAHLKTHIHSCFHLLCEESNIPSQLITA